MRLMQKCSTCKRNLPVEKIVAWDVSRDYFECHKCLTANKQIAKEKPNG